MPVRMQNLVALTAFAIGAMVATTAHAQKKYDPGASDTEIKIGNIMPYSGPASSYGVIGKTEEAFFKMINAEGGINGRKINFISYDDAYSPPKAIEQARKLVESDEVLLIFQPLGTPSNSAIHEVHERQESAAAFRRLRRNQMRRSEELPLDDGLSAQLPERRAHLRQIHQGQVPEQQDRGALAERRRRQGPVQGLAATASATRLNMIIADKSYEVSDPSIDSQIVALHDSGADIFFTWAAPKGSAQAIRKVGELELEAEILPRQYRDLGRFRAQAGRPSICQGHHFDGLSEGPDRSDLGQDDPAVMKWRAFMDKYYP